MRHVISEFPNYEVSDEGKVFRTKDGYELTQRLKNKDRYKTVELWKDNKPHRRYVHRLVALSFLKGFHPTLQVNHIDGNRMNNSISNLEWCTSDENIEHAFRIGLNLIAKLDEKDVLNLLKESSAFVNSQAQKYRVTRKTIRNILVKPGLLYRKYVQK